MKTFYLLPLILLLSITVRTTYAQSTLLVLNKAANTLVFIDPETMKKKGELPTGEGPHEIEISRDGKTAYVANYGHQVPGSTITVVDIASQKQTALIDLGALGRPHGLQEENGKLYFTSEIARAVARYNFVKGKVDWIAGTGQSATHMLALSPDGKRVYTANIYSDNVTVINIGAPPMPDHIKQVEVGIQPEAISVTPDGSEIWVGQNGSGEVTVINASSNTVKQTIKVGEMPIRIKFTSDGKYALVSDPKAEEIILVDVAKKEVLKRLNVPGVPVGIVLSRDNKFLFVSQSKANTVCKIDLEKFMIVGTVSTGTSPDGIGLSHG